MQDAQIWAESGYQQCQAGNYEEAIASFDKAIEIKPEFNLAWYNLGVVLCNHLQRYSDATIKVNLNNYKKRLKKIARENSNNQLQFMQEFSEFSAEKYLQQVETDYINLSPGLTLLQNLISTIQGTIDIYQTKSDRALDNTIAIAGIGLAISGLTATAISAKQPPITSYKDISFLISPVFVWSIIFSAPFLLALIFRLVRR